MARGATRAVRVLRASTAGFCAGVRRAIALAESAARTAGGARVFSDGPLIHNAGEIKRLEALGVKAAPGGAGENAPGGAGDIVIIRAHGAAPERVEALEKAGFRVVDATCPHVKRIQDTVRGAAQAGLAVWIAGDANHAEVKALVAWGSAGAARGGAGTARGGAGTIVVGSGEEARNAPDPGRPITLVAQSSMDEAAFEEIRAAAVARFGEKAVEAHCTVCAAARERRAEVEALARVCDAIVVVGDRSSANSRRLAELAGRLKPTQFVESAEEVDVGALRGARGSAGKAHQTVGVTAGASVPEATIRAVEEKICHTEAQR